jgi:GNAT superfamily N-acetyltransferase
LRAEKEMTSVPQWGERMIEIRPAAATDIDAICEVVRASITDLCHADHKGDPDTLARWLANKTPANVALWLTNTRNINLVADEDGAVLAAGCVTVLGEVILNYVSPAARFRGVSSAVLAALEAEACSKGNVRCTLESTATAYRFYKKRGYLDAGLPGGKHGLTTYPMAKVL